jgi:hypothetical protein
MKHTKSNYGVTHRAYSTTLSASHLRAVVHMATQKHPLLYNSFPVMETRHTWLLAGTEQHGHVVFNYVQGEDAGLLYVSHRRGDKKLVDQVQKEFGRTLVRIPKSLAKHGPGRNILAGFFEELGGEPFADSLTIADPAKESALTCRFQAVDQVMGKLFEVTEGLHDLRTAYLSGEEAVIRRVTLEHRELTVKQEDSRIILMPGGRKLTLRNTFEVLDEANSLTLKVWFSWDAETSTFVVGFIEELQDCPF